MILKSIQKNVTLIIFMILLISSTNNLYVNLILARSSQSVSENTSGVEIGQSNVSSISDNIVLWYSFSSPIIENKGEYDRVSIENLSNYGEQGSPVIPFKTAIILLPPDRKVLSVEAFSMEKVPLYGEFRIEPGIKPIPLSSTEKNDEQLNQSIYNSSDPYPSKLYNIVSIQSLKGYQILILNLYPIQYIPCNGTIFFHSSIEVTVKTAPVSTLENETGKMSVRAMYEDREQVREVVDNPWMVDAYETPAKKLTILYDYVVITNESLKSSFQPLVDWKNTKGVNSIIVTIQQILGNYSGYDIQEKIRNFIIDAYTNWGIKYVLLGGDDEIIPHRGLSAYDDADIASDLYYACLDGNWDNNGNHVYGEDGEEDFYAEVYVGRAPVNTPVEASVFVEKTITCERDRPADYLSNVLMLAAKLDGGTDGGITKDMIEGILPPYYLVTKLYERDFTASVESTTNELNAGQYIVNNIGHANNHVIGLACTNYAAYYTEADVDALTNEPRFFLFYSIGCYANAFDNRDPGGNYVGDAISEHFISNPNGGAFAFIGNSRYGWYYPGYPGEGPSDLYDIEFFDAIFVEGIRHIGAALQDSKEDLIGFANDEIMKWVYYELNLLGDPEAELASSPTPEHEISVQDMEAPNWLQPGETSTINATIGNYGLNNETNVSVDFLVDGVVVDNQTIPFLANGISVEVSFSWTAPSVERAYNLTIYAEPVTGEEITYNNAGTKTIHVALEADAIFQDNNPWDLSANQQILELHNIVYDICTSSDMGNIDLSRYAKVIIASDQSQSFYDRLALSTEWFEEYIAAGGILEIHACDRGWHGGVWTSMPGGFTHTFAPSDYVDISYEGHPILLTPNVITDDELDGWNWATHGYFDMTPELKYVILTYPTGAPVFVEAFYGNGSILASMQPLEWGYSKGYSWFLENVILYTPQLIQHDIAITSLDVPGFVEPSSMVLVNASVYNLGLNNETDVEIRLLINGTVVNSTTIPELLNGASYTIDYLWAPTAEGIYNVTAYAPKVAGENVTINNVRSVFVNVQHYRWESAGSLPSPLSNFAIGIHNGNVYIVGGINNSDSFTTNVYFAPILYDGRIGEWHLTTSLPEGRAWSSQQEAVVYNNRIYVIGGIGPQPPSRIERDTVWYANINPDGSLDDWVSTTPLPDCINSHITILWDGRIYIIGGWTGYNWLNTVYYAEINPDGSLSSWSSTASLPEPRGHGQAGGVRDGVIYELGGQYYTGSFKLHDTVYYGEIDADGKVMRWSATTSLPYCMGGHMASILEDKIFLVYLNKVYSAQIHGDGSLGSWVEEPSLPEIRICHSSVGYNGRLYTFGGYDGDGVRRDSIYYLSLYPPIIYPHELAVTLEAPDLLELGDSLLLNATVYNWGLNNETNVELFLLINGTVVNNATISEMLNGTFYAIDYPWIPMNKGMYNVTAYAPPVLGENITANNVISKMVYVRHVEVALISDNSELSAITEILDSMGIDYDIYNDNAVHLYTEDLSLLRDYSIVIFNEYDRLLTMSEHSALEAYLSYGGNLLVTGYDSLGHPDDPLLADLVRSSSYGDNTGEPDLYVIDAAHPIMNGPYGNFSVGYHVSGLFSDCDRVEADTSRNAITVAELADGYDKIIATEEIGKVVFWNGVGPNDWTSNADCQSMFKNTIVWFMAQYEHELAVSLEAPFWLAPGGSTLLNATVCNRGLNNETSVELQLLINGSLVSSTTIPELQTGFSYTLSYAWTPTVEGMYNVTAYSPSVSGENITLNNQASTYMIVSRNPVHFGDLIIDGNETFIIENVTFTEIGNVYVRDNALLIIRNAELRLNQTNSYQYGIYVYGSAAFQTENVSITSQCWFETYIWGSATANIDSTIFRYVESSAIGYIYTLGNSTVSLHNSTLCYIDTYSYSNVCTYNSKIDTIYGSGSSIVSIYNSEINGLQTYESSSIFICNSTIDYLILSFEDSQNATLHNLLAGLIKYWNIHVNGTVNEVSWNLTLVNAMVMEGWELICYGDSVVSVYDSTLLYLICGEDSAISVVDSDVAWGLYISSGGSADVSVEGSTIGYLTIGFVGSSSSSVEFMEEAEDDMLKEMGIPDEIRFEKLWGELNDIAQKYLDINVEQTGLYESYWMKHLLVERILRERYALEETQTEQFSAATASLRDLNPGFYGFWNLYVNGTMSGVNWNLTLVDSIVKGWELGCHGDSIVSVYDSTLVYLSCNDNSNVSVYDSFIDQLGMWSFAGTIGFDNATLESYWWNFDSDYYIFGNSSFNQGIYIGVWNSIITRNYNIQVTNELGFPVENASLSLFDPNGSLLWASLSDNLGRAYFDITFTEYNYSSTFLLTAEKNNSHSEANVSILSTTPLSLSLATTCIGEIEVILTIDSDAQGFIDINVTLNSTVNLPNGLGAYALNLTVPNDIILLSASGGELPFNAPPIANKIAGQIIMMSFISEVEGPQIRDLLIARLRLRLNSSADIEITILPISLTVVDASSGAEYSSTVIAEVLRLMRGDANNDGRVSIGDAMFIAQYMAGNRPASDLNLLNAASVKQDGTEGDKVSIADAMFIAQYLAGLRDEQFNLKV